jgi:hypothetical protein
VHLLPSWRVLADVRLPRSLAFWRIVGWLRKRHLKLSWGTLHRRLLPGWEVRDGGTDMFRPRAVPIVRYRFRGSQIPTPWASEPTGSPVPAASARGEPDAVRAERPVRRAGRGDGPVERPAERLDPTPTPTSGPGQASSTAFVVDAFCRVIVGWRVMASSKRPTIRAFRRPPRPPEIEQPSLHETQYRSSCYRSHRRDAPLGRLPYGLGD